MKAEVAIEHADKAEWNPAHSVVDQLERAKEELELISYVASHDLQAPLRILQHLCEELNKQKSVVENETTRELANKITHETERMKALMQGMLDYMRLETYGPTRSLIDTNEVLSAALTVLEEKSRSSGAKITYDTLPEVYGHRGRVTRLFVYLIENALKFSGHKTPIIHISAARKGKMVEFCVEDNGLGIDEEYHNMIYGLFFRLHREEEFPGYGIGLALCRKIVESHGGTIWVESALTEGSRFRFVLPATPVNP